MMGKLEYFVEYLLNFVFSECGFNILEVSLSKLLLFMICVRIYCYLIFYLWCKTEFDVLII